MEDDPGVPGDPAAGPGPGQVLLEPTVTTFGFDDIPGAFAALEGGTLDGRAVILPNG